MSRVTLGRLDEKLNNIQQDISKIESHLKYINSKVVEHSIEIATLKTKQKTIWGIIASIGGIIGGSIVVLIQKFFGG